jgi:hypothetical protein
VLYSTDELVEKAWPSLSDVVNDNDIFLQSEKLGLQSGKLKINNPNQADEDH